MKINLFTKIALIIGIVSFILFVVQSCNKQSNNILSIKTDTIFSHFSESDKKEQTEIEEQADLIKTDLIKTGQNQISQNQISQNQTSQNQTSQNQTSQNQTDPIKTGSEIQFYDDEVIVGYSPTKKNRISRRNKILIKNISDSIRLELAKYQYSLDTLLKSNQTKTNEEITNLKSALNNNIAELSNELSVTYNSVSKKIDTQTDFINQIDIEVKKIKTIDTKIINLNNKIDLLIAKKDEEKAREIRDTIQKIKDTERSKYNYFYNSVLYTKNIGERKDIKNAYKIDDQINFHINLINQLGVENIHESLTKKSNNQIVSTIKTKTLMKYVVIHLNSNAGIITKHGNEIKRDTIELNKLDRDNTFDELQLNYSINFKADNIKRKTEVFIDVKLEYFNTNNKKYDISKNNNLTLYVFPKTNLEYLSMKLDDTMKIGIDKFIYLLTSIISLITAAILNYIKRKLKLNSIDINTDSI